MNNVDVSKEIPNLPPTVWIGWIIATATAAITCMTFVYATFPTRAETAISDHNMETKIAAVDKRVDEVDGSLSKRLDRFEDKLDRVILLLRK